MGIQPRNVLGHGKGRAKANQAKHSDKTFAHLQVTRKCIGKFFKVSIVIGKKPTLGKSEDYPPWMFSIDYAVQF